MLNIKYYVNIKHYVNKLSYINTNINSYKNKYNQYLCQF